MNTDTLKGNEVIAVYDGWVDTKIQHPVYPDGKTLYVKKGRPAKREAWTFVYHTSYDALMPVIKKVMQDIEAINTPQGYDYAIIIEQHMVKAYLYIEPLYEAVILAINFINSTKNQ